MKKIKKLKLTALSNSELEKRNMDVLKGGYIHPGGECRQGLYCNCGTSSYGQVNSTFVISGA